MSRHDDEAVPTDATLSEPDATIPAEADTTTVDDRNPEGEDETVDIEHIDDFRPPTARENLRLT